MISMIHVHDLNGCAPTPLAHYLKALGILRLVSEQKDPQARGWWDGERFRLATRIDRETFVRFLQDEYSPTPVFNPWGGRSGFYGGASEKTARAALTGIEQSSDIRFDDFKNAIRTIRRLIDALPKKKTPEGESAKVAQVEDSAIDTSAKGEKPEDEGKAKLIQDIRREVRGRSSVWMDAVVAVVTSGERPTLAFPALFGTGGNEGSKGYASLYMAAIRECLLRHQWDHALPNAVFADAPAVANDWKESFGQFLPEGVASPWDLIFAFEGACTIRSSVSSRNATHSDRWMSSPFYVAPTSYGFASAARLDEFALNKGKEVPGRGEQWFPLWSAPMLQTELSQLFAEGRVTTRRGSTRRSGWSMMRAATSLGVRAGIREFVRYGYLQRNNLASHMAVPVGRVRVPEQLVPEAACLDDLDAKRDWPAAIFREARRKNASPWLRFAQRRMQESLFGVLTHPGEPNRWQALL